MDWHGKKVLVTGADGFIGSHLAERLWQEGARVRAFCLYNSQGSLGWLDSVSPDMRDALDVCLGDIRDSRFVDTACEDIEVVFHLAALIAIPYSYTAPESFIDTNVHGTLNVLEGVRRKGVARLVHTSTSEVYGTPTTLPITEKHPLHAQSPYAASKIAADQLALSFYCSYGAPVVVLRPFNTYGPRQSTRAVTSTILAQLLENGSEILLGRLDTRRDLTFVTDVVEGFVRAAAVPGIEGMTLQLGTGRAVSIGELFEMSCRTVGRTAPVREDACRLRPAASEVMALQSDPALAARLLGWRAEVSLEDGLRRTADWLRDNKSHHGSGIFRL